MFHSFMLNISTWHAGRQHVKKILNWSTSKQISHLMEKPIQQFSRPAGKFDSALLVKVFSVSELSEADHSRMGLGKHSLRHLFFPYFLLLNPLMKNKQAVKRTEAPWNQQLKLTRASTTISV
jgi:hypothetical protein